VPVGSAAKNREDVEKILTEVERNLRREKKSFQEKKISNEAQIKVME